MYYFVFIIYIYIYIYRNLSNNALDENNIPSNISKLTNLRYL